MNLTLSQKSAIDYVKTKTKGQPYFNRAEVTINFHPDRLMLDGTPTLLSLKNDGVFKSQHETGTSNGSLTAYPGGARWLWESEIFGGHYDSVNVKERPKYGALNLNLLGSGGSPRFGSAVFILKSNVLSRTTFCYPDSYYKPTCFSTYETIGSLIELVQSANDDPLDAYIEAHIHGEIRLDKDVECLVLDPAYKGTEVEMHASTFSFPIKWHAGFKLNIEDILDKENYRGSKYIELAQKISKDGYLDPAVIGQAHSGEQYDFQDLKKVWHYLACFGDKNRT